MRTVASRGVGGDRVGVRRVPQALRPQTGPVLLHVREALVAALSPNTAPRSPELRTGRRLRRTGCRSSIHSNSSALQAGHDSLSRGKRIVIPDRATFRESRGGLRGTLPLICQVLSYRTQAHVHRSWGPARARGPRQRSRAHERQLSGRRPRRPACEVLMTVSVHPALVRARSIGDALPWPARHQGRTVVIESGGHAMADEHHSHHVHHGRRGDAEPGRPGAARAPARRARRRGRGPSDRRAEPLQRQNQGRRGQCP